jgi:hypothetical protein
MRDVVGYEGLYGVTEEGAVIAYARTWKSGNGTVRSHDQFELAKEFDRAGYLDVTLTKNGKARHASVHRIVATAYIPNPRNLSQINHKDGIKSNSNAGNLEWCTPLENSQHAIAHGLVKNLRGRDHPQARLTEDQVRNIRARAKAGETNAEISSLFDVTPQTISKIVTRKRWKHLE